MALDAPAVAHAQRRDRAIVSPLGRSPASSPVRAMTLALTRRRTRLQSGAEVRALPRLPIHERQGTRSFGSPSHGQGRGRSLREAQSVAAFPTVCRVRAGTPIAAGDSLTPTLLRREA
jgi:hypothetical protein